jgi:tRNA(Ile)-lysidine synthase
VALLHLGHRAVPSTGWRLRVAHLDHALRPGSGTDAEFVAGLAGRLGLPITVRRTDVAALAGERGDGLEEAGRAARYAFLDELIDEAGADAVAMTAHTLDDQAETVLLNLVRGGGPAGLGGIAARRDRIVRPLLAVRRGDLRGALDAEGIAYLEDPSNADRRFARNRVRADLLPLLESLHPGAAAGIARSASRAAADEAALVALSAVALAARRTADGWLDWRSPPADAIGSRILRLAIGSPAPSAERIAALLDAARGRSGGRSIELGRGRRAAVRRHRVRILHTP